MENNDIRILLIEDNSGDAMLLHELLEDCPFRCYLKRTDRLSIALELIRDGAFNLVLMDLSLPDSYGEDALRQLREVCPELPVIIHSGSFSKDAEEGLRRLGARAFFRKGKFDLEELCSAILVAVGRD